MGMIADIFKKARLIKKVTDLVEADGIRAVGTHDISLTEDANGDITYQIILKGKFTDDSQE
jgi:hypothetical protein